MNLGPPFYIVKIGVSAQPGGQRTEVLGPRTHLGDNCDSQRVRGAQSESRESPGNPKRHPGGTKEAPRGAQKAKGGPAGVTRGYRHELRTPVLL